MPALQLMRQLIIPSFAKLNLMLHITGVRENGYHELQTIYQTIDLNDLLIFEFYAGANFHLVLNVGESTIPPDSTNLIYKACFAFHQVHPLRHRVEVTIRKQIPVESGLGGGSSNAAVTLIALSRFYRWPLDAAALQSIAAEIGADVPFFLTGGTALGTGIGDEITILPDAPPFVALLVHPDVTCSTAEIYRAYDESGLLTARRNFTKITVEKRPEFLRDLISHSRNDLEEVVFAQYPELKSIKNRLLELGAFTAALTGSGSTVFGLFSETGDCERAARSFPGCSVSRFVTRADYARRLQLR